VRKLACIFLVLLSGAFVYTQRSSSTRFAFGSGTSTELPFSITQNLILVKASVNGSTPGTFIFDTGAESTVVDAAFARSAGLTQSGKMTATGSAGSATAGIIKNASVQVGSLSAAGLTVYSLPLDSFTPGFGMRIDGIIGNDIIKHVVADIDYDGQIIRLIEPSAFRPSKSAVIIPLEIQGGLPMIRTEIASSDGRRLPALMEIDTGSTGAVLINSPFVRRHRLLRSLHVVPRKSGGVGGTGTSMVGRLATLRFGEAILREPIAVFYTDVRGDNASRAYDGLIGGGVLRRFRVTVDLRGKRLFIQPGADVGRPFETDMSGMELLADGDDLRTILIDDVSGAAAETGIHGGDVLIGIDGTLAKELGIEKIRTLMRQSGASYDLTVSRDGKLLHFRLTLKRVI